MSKQFDVYSDMRIPFDVATWMRGHKFNPVSVNVTKQLQSLDDLKLRREKIEREIDAQEENLKDLITQARNKMEEADAKH